MHRDKVIKTINILFEIKREVWSDIKQKAWEIALNGLTDDQLDKGINRYIKNDKESFLCTPAKFIEYCDINSNLEDKARLAFALLVKSLNRYSNVVFKDKTISEVVNKMGGWATVCNWETAELKWKEKEFIDLYIDNFEREGTRKQILYGKFKNDKPKYIGFEPEELAGIGNREAKQIQDTKQTPEKALKEGGLERLKKFFSDNAEAK